MMTEMLKCEMRGNTCDCTVTLVPHDDGGRGDDKDGNDHVGDDGDHDDDHVYDDSDDDFHDHVYDDGYVDDDD